MAELQRLGARTLPVVSRGDDFVFAQVIKDVVDFLGLEDDTAPELSPDELKQRYAGILDVAIGLVAAMPNDQLENQLPNRPRSWRVLMHHVFQIPTAFLDMEETGEVLSYENMVAPPPDHLTTSSAIASFGRDVEQRFADWAEQSAGTGFLGPDRRLFRHDIAARNAGADRVALCTACPPGRLVAGTSRCLAGSNPY